MSSWPSFSGGPAAGGRSPLNKLDSSGGASPCVTAPVRHSLPGAPLNLTAQGEPPPCVTAPVRHSLPVRRGVPGAPLNLTAQGETPRASQPPCVTASPAPHETWQLRGSPPVRHSPLASQPPRRPTKLDSSGGDPPCVTAPVRLTAPSAPQLNLTLLLVGCWWIPGQETRPRRATTGNRNYDACII